jgi:pimeloyl-ACP methyl ester carboxylesterase
VGAVDGFGRGICGADYFDVFNRHLPPGWFERWVVDLDTVMGSDMTALPQWAFEEDDAARIKVPVLNMRGVHTVSYMRDIYERLRAWLPQAENQVLADATHAMTQTNPRGAAERQAQFFAAHPMEMGRAA